MDSLKQMVLTHGDNYSFDDDCEMVMENLKQHLYSKLKGCESILGDLTLNPEPLMTEVAVMADFSDDDELNILDHYRCLAGTCMRIVVYDSIRRILDSKVPNE